MNKNIECHFSVAEEKKKKNKKDERLEEYDCVCCRSIFEIKVLRPTTFEN